LCRSPIIRTLSQSSGISVTYPTNLTNFVATKLRSHGISNKVDDSSQSIGRRYARNDELGTPFGITVDFQTVKDNTITLRERDSTTQIRASPEDIMQIIKDIVDERRKWSDVVAQYGEFKGQEVD
jgi:glycyl-tRNA synthetase